MKKIIIIEIPDEFSKLYIRKKIKKLIENLKTGQPIIEKECTHSDGCDMVSTKFICNKEGYCDK